ncbi:hypothetical protein N658DRAFT_518019 [Parathielavia hyrcaniae]|uniref:Aminoglycoside phosphotransferase domain-containing protein n=1 Tax=Parathielavia hyrcaniae TaxID=113614 RepID=A0AAN6PV80_9PEZI|nr:hypothetical protein N658DRAFT_518019 [Parathielavia hyrcaniae]
MQGMYSRTLFVTLADGREVVVQFRTEQLDLDAFNIARDALGDVVPHATALPDEELEAAGAWAYSFNRLPGTVWVRGMAGRGAEGRIAVNKSLGQVFARGWLAEGSGEAVTKRVRPHLEVVLASELEAVTPYRALLQGLLDRVDEFGRLPPWVTHYDVNDVNVLIDDGDCSVTGVIDWELSAPKPFGVRFGLIHTLAGEFTGGEFRMPDEFELAEGEFWKELFGGMPKETRAVLEENINLVQDAVILGTLLDAFFWEEGKVGCG